MNFTIVLLEQCDLGCCDGSLMWLKWERQRMHRGGPLNLQLAGKATCCMQHGACGDIWNEKTSLNSFPGKAVIDYRNILKTYELFIYGDIQSVINLFCKSVLKIWTPQPRL